MNRQQPRILGREMLDDDPRAWDIQLGRMRASRTIFRGSIMIHPPLGCTELDEELDQEVFEFVDLLHYWKPDLTPITLGWHIGEGDLPKTVALLLARGGFSAFTEDQIEELKKAGIISSRVPA